MKNRKLKVRPVHRYCSLKSQGNKGLPITSFILLKGTWLEKAGFIVDTPVSVTVQKNRLVLEPQNSN